MIRLLFLLCLTTSMYSSEIDRFYTVNSLKLSTNENEYKEISYTQSKTLKLKKFKLKLGIEKPSLENNTYYLTIVGDMKALSYTNAKYSMYDHMMVITLDKHTPDTLYFYYEYEQVKRPEFRFNVITPFEYKYLLPYEGILYGLAYGIIFSAFIYYLVIFVSTKRVCFFYYSIMQLCVLLSLIGFTYFSFQPYPKEIPQILVDMFETGAFLFSFLFGKEILNTKKVSPFINHILNIAILIHVLDLIAIIVLKGSYLYEEFYFYAPFLLLTISGVIVMMKGQKNAFFYTLGWFVLFSFVWASEQDLIHLSSIYTIHIAAPLESLIFSFALAFMLKQLVKKQNEQEKLLIHKSKLASMGEMIDNIAHQWRQPLMHLGYINMNLEMSSEQGEFEKTYFIKKIKESNSQIKFMSQTIDDFRDFYKVEKDKHSFFVSNACQLAINIIKPTLEKRDIEVQLDIKSEHEIKGYENEYAQVILNLLTNSMEAFELRKIEKAQIIININSSENKIITSLSDNAGGIPPEQLDNVFKPHFSTKKRGSGIGLYMSQIIIQSHFNGFFSVHNSKDGACFIITV